MEPQISCREKSRSDATDPCGLQADTSLWVVCIIEPSIPPLEGKGPDTASGVLPVTQRRTEHSAVGREAPSLTAKMAFSAEEEEPARGSAGSRSWEHHGLPRSSAGTPTAAKLQAGRAPSRDPGGILSLQVSVLVKDQGRIIRAPRFSLPTVAWDEAHAPPLHSALSPAQGRRALKELPFHY